MKMTTSQGIKRRKKSKKRKRIRKKKNLMKKRLKMFYIDYIIKNGEESSVYYMSYLLIYSLIYSLKCDGGFIY
jgi:hypothetical protein